MKYLFDNENDKQNLKKYKNVFKSTFTNIIK